MSFLAVFVFLCWQGYGVVAQTTTEAICTLDPWTSNSRGQSPCQVASIIQGVCNGGLWDIPKIAANTVYAGPRAGQSTNCQCNTVAFSLVAACGACQGGTSTSWDLWMKNCTASDITIGNYPRPIPGETSIPHWAYLDVVTGNAWNLTAALNDVTSGSPESSGSAPTATSGSTTAGSPPTTSTGSSNAGSTAAPSKSSGSSSTNAGAIAGGVVGGVVGLALIALLGFLLWRRNNRKAAPSAQFVNGARGEKVDLVGSTTPAPYGGGFQSPPLPMQEEQPKLYDPSDPSTFPTTPPPSSPGSVPHGWTSPAPSAPYSQASGPGPYTPTTGPYGQPFGHQHQASGTFAPQQPMGGYSGAPEV